MTADVRFEARLVAIDRSNNAETPIACITIERVGEDRRDPVTSASKTMLSIQAWVTPDRTDHTRDCVEARNIRANGVMSALRRALYDVGRRRRRKPDPNEIPW